MSMKKEISGIIGGTSISDIDYGDSIVAEDLLDTYYRYAGSPTAVESKVKSALHNGFTEDLPSEKKIELENGIIWGELFGYAGWIIEGENIQAINPRVAGVGFVISEVSDMGEILEIKMKYGPDIGGIDKSIPVKRAPFSLNGIGDLNGFYPFRTQRGLPGPRGVSTLLPLVMPIRGQAKIHSEYSKYAEHQGLAHPVVKIENLTPSKKSDMESTLNAPKKDLAVVIDMRDEFDYKSPQQNAYDPSAMIDFADKLIVRHTSMNMQQLTGVPMGYLSASQTNVNEWFTSTKTYQDHIFPQILPVLMALGLTKEVKFQDPSEPTFLEKMEGVKVIKEVFMGLIEPQQLLDLISDHMGYEGNQRLKLVAGFQYFDPNNPNNQNNQNNNNNQNDKNGNKPNSKTD